MTPERPHARPILVTGAAGAVGSIGRNLTEMLLAKGHKVRAMVRREDQRAEAHSDRARARSEQAGDHTHERGLARPVWADYPHGLGGVDLEVDAEQYLKGTVGGVNGF